MRKILLINRGVDTDNIGDVAINQCLTLLFERANCKVVSANFTGFFLKKRFLQFILEAVDKIRKSDLIVIGGGQLFQSNRKFPLSFAIWVFLSFLLRRQVVVFAAGFDESFTKRDTKLIRMGLRWVSKVYVRDDVSKKSCLVNFGLDVKQIVDPVFLLGQLVSEKGEAVRSTVLIGIVTYSSIYRYKFMDISYHEYLDLHAQYVLDAQNDGLEVFLIYNSQSDYKQAQDLKEYIHKNYEFSIEIKNCDSLDTYLDIIRGAKKVISGRLHALIIAKSLRVQEVVPIIRNQKLESGQHIVNDFDMNAYGHLVRIALQDVLSNDS